MALLRFLRRRGNGSPAVIFKRTALASSRALAARSIRAGYSGVKVPRFIDYGCGSPARGKCRCSGLDQQSYLALILDPLQREFYAGAIARYMLGGQATLYGFTIWDDPADATTK